jgi:DNA repair exonuclease SbcCD ATPase subunit
MAMDEDELKTTPVMMLMFNDAINQINQTLKQVIDNQNALMKNQYEDNADRPKIQNLENELALIKSDLDELKRQFRNEEQEQNNVQYENRNQDNSIKQLEKKIRDIEYKIK